MAPPNYYSQKELMGLGIEGFARIDEVYGGGRKGRRQPNYGHATYRVTSRQLPPSPPPAATSAFAVNHSAASSSSGYPRRLHQQGYTYRYSPPESVVCWTPAGATAAETTAVVRGYEAVTLPLRDGEIPKYNYKYY